MSNDFEIEKLCAQFDCDASELGQAVAKAMRNNGVKPHTYIGRSTERLVWANDHLGEIEKALKIIS